MTITFAFRRGYYLTLVNGSVEEAYRDLVEFLDSLPTFALRYSRRFTS